MDDNTFAMSSNSEKTDTGKSSTCTMQGLKTFKRFFLFFSMIILMLASAAVLALTASGLLQNEEQIECSREDVAELEKYDTLYSMLGVATLILSLIGLLGVWKKNNCVLILFVLGMSVLSITVVVLRWTARSQEQEKFKERYVALLPLTNHTPPCSLLSNVHDWQAKYKCCGLINGYQDWEFAVPDSCLCDPDEGTALCTHVSNSTTQSTNKTTRYYVKPCLPQVLPHVGKSILNSSSYIITIWIVICCIHGAVGILMILGFFMVAIVLQVVDLLYTLHHEKAEKRYLSQSVPVLYVRKGPDKADSEAAEAASEDEAQWDESNDCPMLLVTMEELERMQVGIDPPPYTAVFKCNEPEFMSKPFYVVHIPADAPLPSGSRLFEGLNWAQMTPQNIENGHRVFLLPHPPVETFCQDYSY